jgi:hypothetical protein
MAYCFGDGFDLYAAPADAVAGYWDSGASATTALLAGRFAGSQAIRSTTGAVATLVKSSDRAGSDGVR